MAFTGVALSAGEISAFAADKPILIGKNALEDRVQDSSWQIVEEEAIATDLATTGFETGFAADGQHGVVTKPDTNASLSYYFKMELTETVNLVDNGIDGLGIFGHNFNALTNQSGGPYVIVLDLQISNNADYTAKTSIMGRTLPSGGDNRLPVVEYTLIGGFARWRKVRHIQLKITTTNPAGFGVDVPEIGQIVLAHRRQMSRQPLDPWDPRPWGAEQSQFRSDSGSSANYEFNAGGIITRPRWHPNPDDTVHNLDDTVTLQKFWRDVNYGPKTFYWTEKPFSAENETHVMKAQGNNPRLGMPFRTPKGRNMNSITMVEQSPYLEPFVAVTF